MADDVASTSSQPNYVMVQNNVSIPGFDALAASSAQAAQALGDVAQVAKPVGEAAAEAGDAIKSVKGFFANADWSGWAVALIGIVIILILMLPTGDGGGKK